MSRYFQEAETRAAEEKLRRERERLEGTIVVNGVRMSVKTYLSDPEKYNNRDLSDKMIDKTLKRIDESTEKKSKVCRRPVNHW